MLTGFADAYQHHWAEGMAAKLGLAAPDRELAEDILELMQSQKVDFTRFFRALSAGTARTLFTEPEPFDAWSARREVLLPADRVAVAAAMDRVNPVYIPRNHRVEEALAQATDGDLGHSTVWWTSSPAPSTSGPAWRTTPVRPPRAAPRTSPTAVPEHESDNADGRSARLLGAFVQ